jgi:hypothetical protein
MKTFVTLLTILLAMVFVMPAFAGEEPYKAAVWDDCDIPAFHISPKIAQFTHGDTNYYNGCFELYPLGDPRVDISVCEAVPPLYLSYYCPANCREKFTYQASAVDQPEVCCAERDLQVTDTPVPAIECPDNRPWGRTALITAGNGGWYEWVIGLPKKPESELNLEIQCGVLKPNAAAMFETPYQAVNLCAAVTGEQIGTGLCTRVTGSPLITSALPRLEVIAHPGCNSSYKPFHMTAYRNPSQYSVTVAADPDCKPAGTKCLNNSQSLQVLDGTVGTRFAIKSCLEKTILVKWPKEGQMNELGEIEHALQAGDLIQVKVKVTGSNTVDLYCGKYSVTIGGIGEPNTLLDDENCSCIPDAQCQL